MGWRAPPTLDKIRNAQFVMPLPTREDIEAKLLNNSLIRVLFFERWFRVAFAAFLLVFIFLALFLPKIWRTSKAGFMPVVKVSGLDLVQAWSLKRTALKAQAAGNFVEANLAWQSALANNMADPDLVRGSLRNLLSDPHPREHVVQGMQESYWLLRLNNTNLVDLELVSQVFALYKYYDPIVTLLEPRQSVLSPPLMAAYLKALFSVGRVDAFNDRWQEFSPRIQDDPDLRLYRAAYLAGWGAPGTIKEGRDTLDAATAEPARRILAWQLKLIVSAHQLDVGAYHQALEKLAEWHEDLLPFHLSYWRLLSATGKKDEAIQLAEAYPYPPATPGELVDLAQLYTEFGRRDKAIEFMNHYAPDLGNAPLVWMVYANLLIEAKRWDDLRNLAVQIRSRDSVADSLSGFSYFIEGRAEAALDRQSNAAADFKKAAEREYAFPSVAQQVAAQLLTLGYPELAREMLGRLEKPLQKEFNYWSLLFTAADRLKDVDLMLKAASRAYELRPVDPRVVNNYAAALLIARQRPDEAIKLTLQLVNQQPDSFVAVVNHSAALLMNDRAREAEALLSRVSTN